VVGVRVVLVSVGVVVSAAVVGVAVRPFVVAMAGAAVAAVVVPPVDAAVVPVVDPPTAARNAASSVGEPPMTTGVGAELMDAFTVACGLAYADGGMS
jgi:hypothetical protein